MKLNQSRVEIQKAENSFQSMKDSKTLHEFETHWRDFIINIEKAWIKSERECQDFKNKFQPWQGNYVKSRRIDPLLKYMKNARDADMHSIQEIVEKINGSSSINPLNKKIGLHIDKLVIKNGKIVEYEGSQPLIIENKPAKIEAIPFVNQGTTYFPPTYHKGKSLKNPKNPIEIGGLALEFYSNYLNEIEKKF